MSISVDEWKQNVCTGVRYSKGEIIEQQEKRRETERQTGDVLAPVY